MTPKIEDKFENFAKALEKLNEINTKASFSNLEKTGLIQRFNFTIELAWKTIETVLDFEGNLELIRGSKDVIRIAVKRNLIKNPNLWMEMIEKRNQMSHQYDEDKSLAVFNRIKSVFVGELNIFRDFVKSEYLTK